MRSRGVDPDDYTYGVMVRGYAKAQLVDRIGETMQHISDEEQLDPDLLRALGAVQKRQDLTSALEKSRIEKEKKELEEAERKAAEERKRFETPRFASLFSKALRFRPETHWDNGDGNDAMEEADEPLQSHRQSEKPHEQTTLTSTDLASEQPQSLNAFKANLAFKTLLAAKEATITAKHDKENSDKKSDKGGNK
jgi:hypothetical protein